VKRAFLPLVLLACAPKPVDRSQLPAALDARPFVAPATREATLGNGLRVVVAESHEVPLAWARLAFRGGGHADPVGHEGLASVTLDMMNEGAGEYDAVGLSSALEKLGSDLGTSAGDDGASVWIGGLSGQLEPTLDLFATVLLDPTFPQSEWDLLRSQRIAALEKQRKDPDWIASRVLDRVLLGDVYRGRVATADSYNRLTTADMKAWWAENIVPERAVLIAGGDVTLEELTPLLEKRLAAWKPHGASPPPVVVARPTAPAPAIHLVDRPGAAQSVLRVGGYVSGPKDAEWFALQLANQVMGGQFTSRLNMNLREQKGWTYGARSGFGYDLVGGRFVASTGVHSEHTVEAIGEVLRELSAPASERPFAAPELDDGRAALVQGFPLRFESPDYLLGQAEAVWRYGLPADWVSTYVQRISAPDLNAASTAWKATIDPSKMTIVVVGDAAKLREPLAGLGWSVIERDTDGAPLVK
jgi:zinc protease